MATLVLVLLLGIFGTVAGPNWSPEPYQNYIIPETADTSIGSDVETPGLGTYGVTETVETVTLRDGAQIQVTLRAPVTDDPTPGVVFVHGTGTYLHTAFTPHARALASAGITTAVPDKRLDRYSAVERDYVFLSKDIADVRAWLAQLDGVNPQNVGVYGESEGAFVAPIVAAEVPATAFVALVSSPVLPIRQQGALAADTYLRELGVPDAVLGAIPRLIGGELPGGFDYIDFEVGPYQEEMEQPVFIAYGTGDISMPVVQGATEIIDDIAENGNTDYTLRYYEDADHGLRVRSDSADATFETDAMRDLSRWINGLPRTANAQPKIAGDQPHQTFTAEAPGTPRWYASGTAALVILLVGFGLSVLAGVVGLAGQIRIRGNQLVKVGRAAGPLTVAAISVIVAFAAFVAYILAIATLAMSYETDNLLVRGGWLLVQALAILAAYCVVRLGFAWSQSEIPTRGGKIMVALSFVGLLTLLLALAYWGPYPSIFTALRGS